MEVSGVHGEFLLVLRHLLQHLGEISHCRLVAPTRHAFVFCELLQLIRHLDGDGGGVKVSAGD